MANADMPTLSDQLKALYGDIVGGREQVRRTVVVGGFLLLPEKGRPDITTIVVDAISPDALRKLTVKEIGTISKQERLRVTPEQLTKVTKEQLEAVFEQHLAATIANIERIVKSLIAKHKFEDAYTVQSFIQSLKDEKARLPTQNDERLELQYGP